MMSSDLHIDNARPRIVKRVEADDYEYQQNRAIVNIVRIYVRRHHQRVIGWLQEDGKIPLDPHTVMK